MGNFKHIKSKERLVNCSSSVSAPFQKHMSPSGHFKASESQISIACWTWFAASPVSSYICRVGLFSCLFSWLQFICWRNCVTLLFPTLGMAGRVSVRCWWRSSQAPVFPGSQSWGSRELWSESGSVNFVFYKNTSWLRAWHLAVSLWRKTHG